MLYIVATPIGNLKDITFRALEVLKAVDYILCEDTRVSRILLNHYDIKTPLKSYHKFNEKKFLESILTDLKNFKEIALISDAGTPIISDPGNILVKEAIKNNLKITTIPGANSVISALTLSDMDTLPFQFLGFFKDEFLNRIIFYDGISIFFESSKKILKTIEKIKKIDPERNISIFKELTKKFETRIYKKAKDLHEYLLK
ncbi:MAG: 16S rRNA (cytidine(1402)-2'-O)-methyltransferase, partial [Chlamydiae bacterium RIFCSPLOWO2_01_FULL_28_7]